MARLVRLARRGQHRRRAAARGAAAIFGVTLMVQQDTKPPLSGGRPGVVGAQPGRVRRPQLASRRDPGQERRRRAPCRGAGCGLVGAAALILSFAQSPGQISPDTKLDLTANPLRFLARAANLWNSDLPFGQAQNQAYGYLFPHGAFFLLGDVARTARLGDAAAVVGAAARPSGSGGCCGSPRRSGIGTTSSRVIAAVAFALSPRVLTTLGVDLVGDAADDAGAVGAAAGDPRAARDRAARRHAAVSACWPRAARARRVDGRGQRGRDPDRMPGRGDLVGRATGRTGCGGGSPRGGLLGTVLAVLWWVVALVLLGRVSPPFLDFIESSGVTTQWTSLTEMLRGTDSWTPFVAPDRDRGLVAGDQLGGGAGDDAGRRGRAGGAGDAVDACAGRLVTMLLVGVALLAVGYSGGLGSPLAHQVQAVPRRGGRAAAQRAQARTGDPAAAGPRPRPPARPGPAARAARRGRCGCTRCAHPERDKRVAVGIVVLVALAVGTSLAWTGRLTPPGTFTRDPAVLARRRRLARRAQRGSPTPGRVLVVPGAPFATQVWGTSHDEPLQVLGDSPWGVRDSIPLTPPADHPCAGLGAAAARRGPAVGWAGRYPCPAGHFVCRRAQRPRPGHVAVGATDPGAPRDRRLPGPDEGGAVRRPGRPRHVGGVHHRQRTAAALPGGRDLPRRRRQANLRAPVPRRHRRDGARRRWPGGAAAARRTPPTPRPAAAGADAADRRRATRRPRRCPSSPSPTPRWPARPTTAASTTTRRRSARQATPGTPSTGCSTTRRAAPTWSTARGPAGGSRCRARRRTRPRCPTSRRRTGPAAAIDGDSVDQLGVQRAAGGGRAVAAGRLRPPDHQRDGHASRRARPPSAHRSAASRSRPPTAPARCGSTSRASR